MSQRSIFFGSLEDELTSTGIEGDFNEKESEVNDDIKVITFSNMSTKNTTSNSASTSNSNSGSNSNSKPASNSEFDRRNLAKTLKIPTDDQSVRSNLISLNQPITLFGEGPSERRDRLRMMASRAICSLPNALELFPILKTMISGQDARQDQVEDSDSEDEEFYVPGSVNLVQIRSFLLQDSISRAKSHVATSQTAVEHSTRRVLYTNLSRDLDLRSSMLDSSGRPLSACVYTREGELVTGDLGGRVVKYNAEGSSSSGKVVNLNGASERITAMCSDLDLFMTGTATGTIHMYKANTLDTLNTMAIDTKHAVTSLEWHPSSRFFASTSADSLWRLWDPHQGVAVQIQEGHVGGISSGAWHPHGGIYCTGGTTDGVVRVWDCRLGRAIWNITTTCATTALAFSPQSPHLLAAASSDGLISLHDLRQLQASYLKSVAHQSSCTALKFAGEGRLLVSSGFDGHVRVWGPGDMRLIKELSGGSAKIMDMDVYTTDNDHLRIAAVTFDKSIKIYSS